MTEAMRQMLWEAWYRDEDSDDEIRKLELALNCSAPDWVWKGRMQPEPRKPVGFDSESDGRSELETR